MIMLIFSIFDDKAEVFSKPFYDPTIGAALRNFQDAAKDPQTTFNKHPEDFTLFQLGHFDDLTGELIKLDEPKLLGQPEPVNQVHEPVNQVHEFDKLANN